MNLRGVEKNSERVQDPFETNSEVTILEAFPKHAWGILEAYLNHGKTMMGSC
jgi:hypothetical protein